MKNQNREDHRRFFLRLAKLISTRSTCPRRSCGAVAINKHRHIIATGYNGVPKGYPHCIDIACPGVSAPSGTGLDKCMATHAEQNALLQCPDVQDIFEFYITDSPCPHCAKLLANTSVKHVIYDKHYSDTTGIDLLTSLGIECIHLPLEETETEVTPISIENRIAIHDISADIAKSNFGKMKTENIFINQIKSNMELIEKYDTPFIRGLKLFGIMVLCLIIVYFISMFIFEIYKYMGN